LEQLARDARAREELAALGRSYRPELLADPPGGSAAAVVAGIEALLGEREPGEQERQGSR
jgi:hypothetical protein